MSPTTANVSDLIAQVARGDEEAFNALYRTSSAKLYGIVLRILRRRAIADEVMQEIYVKIWQRAGEFDPKRASPITWMATIARNRAIDEARRTRLPIVSDDTAALAAEDAAPSAVDAIEQEQDRRRLDECLHQLEETRRTAVRLAYLDGLSRQELAARFEQPIGTIKTWLHRSLRQVRDCLEP